MFERNVYFQRRRKRVINEQNKRLKLTSLHNLPHLNAHKFKKNNCLTSYLVRPKSIGPFFQIVAGKKCWITFVISFDPGPVNIFNYKLILRKFHKLLSYLWDEIDFINYNDIMLSFCEAGPQKYYVADYRFLQDIWNTTNNFFVSVLHL